MDSALVLAKVFAVSSRTGSGWSFFSGFSSFSFSWYVTSAFALRSSPWSISLGFSPRSHWIGPRGLSDASIARLKTVFVRLYRLRPMTSPTSTDANSHDSAGKETLKLMRIRSPSWLRSTTTFVSNVGVRYEPISLTSKIAMMPDARTLMTLPGIVPSVMSFGILR